MDRTRYHEMRTALDIQRQNAWAFIFESWHTQTWKPIPQDKKNILNLHSLLGMYNGQLCTQASAKGGQEFVQRLNNRKIR